MDILVVSNDKHAGLLVQAIKETADDVRCTRVQDGAGALTYLHYEPTPVLIIVDEAIPGLSCYELIKRIRSDVRNSQIPLIVLTENTNGEKTEEWLTLGAVAVLSKKQGIEQMKEGIIPFMFQELILA